MKFKVIDNFIDKTMCNELIEDAKKHCQNDHIEVLNKRLLLASTSEPFTNLLKRSKAWNIFHNRLNSQEFLSETLNYLDCDNKMFHISNFFFKKDYSKFHKKFKNIGSKKIVNVSILGLIFFIFYKIYRNFLRIIKYKFSKQKYVELLYDYSKSPNGYYREIHRDTDSRTVVFLLYLNELSPDASGGELCFYKYKHDNKKIPPQPHNNDCQIIKTIPPLPGRMVVFLNSNDSLHSVNVMQNHNEYRHFIYGSFTLLGKKNSLISNSSKKLKTNFNLLD